MTIKDLLKSKGLQENVNYSLKENENGIVIKPILSKRWIPVAAFDEAGEPIPSSLCIEEEYLPEIPPLAELQEELALEKSLKIQKFGSKVLAKVRTINEAKGLDPAAFDALMEDKTIAKIERLLLNGSLSTARKMIENLPPIYFSDEEKLKIIQMIDGSGLIEPATVKSNKP